ncbi:MAG: VOC family protein [Pseudomonadota bacterium]
MSSPVVALDHVKLSVSDLDAATRCYQALFDMSPLDSTQQADGIGVTFATPNLVLHLDAAEDPAGLYEVGMAVDDDDRIRRRLQRLGLRYERDLSRDPLLKSKDFCASMALKIENTRATRGLAFNFLHRPEREAFLADSKGGGSLGLDHLVVASSDPNSTAFLFAAQLGLDMRLDMQNDKWGGRFLFFRCGDLIVEVVSGLTDRSGEAEQQGDQTQDTFYGLSWRVSDASAARARLLDAGFEVSELRDGRRPGTTVFTLKDIATGTPTLILQPPK